MVWKRESRRHSLARRGVKTASPRSQAINKVPSKKIPSPKKEVRGTQTNYVLPHRISYFQYDNGTWGVWNSGWREALVKTKAEARKIAEKLYLQSKR